MATRESLSAETDPTPLMANFGMARAGGRMAFRSPRPLSWPPPLPAHRVPVAPPRAASLPLPNYERTAPVFDPAPGPIEVTSVRPPSVPRWHSHLASWRSRLASWRSTLTSSPGLMSLRLGMPSSRSPRVIWSLAGLLAVSVGVLAASSLRPRPSDRANTSAGPRAMNASLSPRPLSAARPVASAGEHPTTSWGASSAPPVVSVWELPVVHKRPPARGKYGFHVPAAPVPPHAIFAAGAN
jgi:hypothetical protein